MGWILRRRSGRGLSVPVAALLGAAALAGGAEPRTWPVGEDSPINIRGLAFSPDGRTLAAASLNGAATLWDLARGRPRATLNDGLPGSVYAVAFSPDGSTVATAHGELPPPEHGSRVQLWDAATGALRKTIAETDRRATSVVFSRDGRRLGMIDEGRTARVCDVTDGRVISRVTFAEPFISAAFAPDLATLAASDAEGIRLVEVATGREVAAIGRLPNHPLSLAFSPDGKALACGLGTPMTMSGMGGMNGVESLVRIWDISGESPKERATLKGIASWVGPIAFSPDGASIVTSGIAGGGGTGGIVWDVATGARRATLEGEGVALAFSPDGKALARAGSVPGVSLWDAETWAISARLDGRGATRVAFLPDGKTLAIGYSDGTVALRDPADGRARLVLQAGNVAEDRINGLAVSRDGALIAAGLRRGGARVWDAATGAGRHARYGFGNDLGEVTALAFAPGGESLALGGFEGSIWLWRLTPGLGGTLRGHEGRVVGLAFAPDGKTLASAGSDGTIRLWDVEGRRERVRVPVHSARVPRMKHERMVKNGQVITMSSQIPGEFEDRPIPLGSMALSPDGTTIATGDAGLFMGTEEVSLRDAATGRQRLTFRPGPGDHAGNVQVAALAFSPDGKWLASAVGKAVRISDVPTGRERLTLQVVGSWPIADLSFASDGRSLAACSARGIWIWDLPAP